MKVEERRKPLFLDGLPLQYTGTLSEKVDKLYQIHGEILQIAQNPLTRPSDSILKKRADMEVEISRHLIAGEEIENKFIDYCLRNFAGSSHTTGTLNRRDGLINKLVTSTVFDTIPKVAEFVSYIGKSAGQRILSTYDNIPVELGIISGSVWFHIDRTFRYMNVPVEKLHGFENGEWTDKDSPYGLHVNPDIFSHPNRGLFSFFSNKNIWKTDHSDEIYFGGPAPKESGMYIGDMNVNRKLSQAGL